MRVVSQNDFAQVEHRLSGFLEYVSQQTRIPCPRGRYHADSAIEGAGEFNVRQPPHACQPAKYRRQCPSARVDAGYQPPAHETRDVFQQSTTGDMCQCLKLAGTRGSQTGLHINPRRRQKVERLVDNASVLGDQLAHQRIAIRMDTRRRQAKQPVSGLHRTGQYRITFDSTYCETGEIEIARLVDIRHFRRFATNERASGLPATIGDSCYQSPCALDIEPGSRQIVEKEERRCPLNDEVIDAHGDQINTETIDSVYGDGKQELGTDTIRGRDQYRIAKTAGSDVKQTTETTEIGIAAGPGRRLHNRPDRFDQCIAGGDVDAGGGVSIAVRFASFLFQQLLTG